MATSGKIGVTQFDVGEVIDAATLRCGVLPAQNTPETLAAFRRNLTLILTRISAPGAALWAIEKRLVGLTANRAIVDLNYDALAIKNARYMSPTRVAAVWTSSTGENTAPLTDNSTITSVTQAAAGGNFAGVFDAASTVAVVGVCIGVAGTYGLEFERSDDGVTWTTALSVASADYAAGAWLWVELTAYDASLRFRVRSTGSTPLSVREIVLAGSCEDIDLAPLSLDEYANLPNHYLAGQPLQYWFDRQITPRLHLWPVPVTAIGYIEYWQQRAPQDAGRLANTLDLPIRWYEPVIYRLAAQTILEIPGADVSRQDKLFALADRFEKEIGDDESDHTPVSLLPNIGCYTR